MDINLLMALSDAFSPPGDEGDVALMVVEELKQLYRVEKDVMNNVIAWPVNFDENKPVLMIDAHLDEVAMMVHMINDDGTIKVVPLGGLVAQNFAASKMVIRNSKNEKIGAIVGSTPPHFKKTEGELTMSDIYLDVGASNKSQVTNNLGIDIGDFVVPDVCCYIEKELNTLVGKAFDDRVGVFGLVEVLKELADKDLPWNVVGSFSSQEEVGLRGAKVNVRRIKPDIAIVLEGTPCDDRIRSKSIAQGALRNGVQIRLRDGSMVANRKIVRLAKEVAKIKNISYQLAVREGGGTNGGIIHLETKAVPVLVLGAPVRFAHTHYGIVCIDDIESMIKLCSEMAKVQVKAYMERE